MVVLVLTHKKGRTKNQQILCRSGLKMKQVESKNQKRSFGNKIQRRRRRRPTEKRIKKFIFQVLYNPLTSASPLLLLLSSARHLCQSLAAIYPRQRRSGGAETKTNGPRLNRIQSEAHLRAALYNHRQPALARLAPAAAVRG